MSHLETERFYENLEELKAESVNCSHCQDTQEYEGETCPYCVNKKQEEGERAMDFNKGN